MGSKLITSFPGNPAAYGLPAVQAVMVVFDGRDGRVLALLDGTELTYWRTAADSALGASLLAPSAPSTLLVVGAGAMAPWLVRAHRCARPSLQQVLLWNRRPGEALRLAAQLQAEGIKATGIEDLAAGVAAAEVVSCCTRSTEALIQGDWLRPGTHLDLVGGYNPQTREADDTAIRRSRVYVDCRVSALDGVGDILQPLASGALHAGGIVGDLYGLISGTAPGRANDEEITLFKNAGGGHLDLMTAAHILDRLATL